MSEVKRANTIPLIVAAFAIAAVGILLAALGAHIPGIILIAVGLAGAVVLALLYTPKPADKPAVSAPATAPADPLEDARESFRAAMAGIDQQEVERYACTRRNDRPHDPGAITYSVPHAGTTGDYVTLRVITDKQRGEPAIIAIAAAQFSSWRPVRSLSTTVRPRLPVASSAAMWTSEIMTAPSTEQAIRTLTDFLAGCTQIVGYSLSAAIDALYQCDPGIIADNREYYDCSMIRGMGSDSKALCDEYGIRASQQAGLLEDCVADGLAFAAYARERLQ